MSNEIILHEGTKLLGINNIVLTELDGTLYINNIARVESSTKGAFSFYAEDGFSLSGTGKGMTWDKIEELLEVTKMSTGEWFGFASLLEKYEQPYKIKLMLIDGEETLCFVTNEYIITNTPSKISLALSKDKFYIKTGLNIEQRIIQNSIGSVGDSIGDVAIDENYFYYCMAEFDGTTKIWRRSKLEEW
jgi:hypothetical protein